MSSPLLTTTGTPHEHATRRDALGRTRTHADARHRANRPTGQPQSQTLGVLPWDPMGPQTRRSSRGPSRAAPHPPLSQLSLSSLTHARPQTRRSSSEPAHPRGRPHTCTCTCTCIASYSPGGFRSSPRVQTISLCHCRISVFVPIL